LAEKTVVKWQNSYSVGIKMVDEQHKELIKFTNTLFNSCLTGHEQSRAAFLNIIHEAVNYIDYHFSTEEKIMERVNYPDLPEHRGEHKSFVREVFVKVEDFSSGKLLVPLTFVYFLRDWVFHHIAVCDKKMGDYLIALKKSGALHNMTITMKKYGTTEKAAEKSLV
jgi:hemerythrin